MASTGVTPQETIAFRRGTVDGRKLTPQEREDLMRSYLPPAPSSSSRSPSRDRARSSQPKSRSAKRQTGLIRHALHVFLFTIIHIVFSVYFRFRSSYRLVKTKIAGLIYHHHRTPEFIKKDCANLHRKPKHLSVILDYNESDDDQGNAGLEGLSNDVCEIAAWCASAEIPLLSIYERTGKLKSYIPQTHAAISANLESYFGPQRQPTLTVRSPHLQSYESSPQSSTRYSEGSGKNTGHLNVLLLSAPDGRDTMVDLTKTLSEMAQKGTLQSEQIINTDLIDAELSEAVSEEPELLILFSPTMVLKGYPPWQLRLTEIFHLPDNKGVNYQVFIRALHNFSRVEMRLGK